MSATHARSSQKPCIYPKKTMVEILQGLCEKRLPVNGGMLWPLGINGREMATRTVVILEGMWVLFGPVSCSPTSTDKISTIKLLLH